MTKKSSFKSLRKFNGQLFVKHQNTHHTKSLAKKDAKTLREKGFKARVVEAPSSKGNYWLIYKRKKR